MAVILSVIALLLTLADTYIVFSLLGNISWFVKGWLFLPALIYWALIIWMAFTGDTRLMFLNGVMWITICVVIPTLVFTVFSLVGKGLGLIWHPIYPIMSWTGASFAAAWFVIAVYGSVFGWRRLEVKNTDITLADLPENFNG